MSEVSYRDYKQLLDEALSVGVNDPNEVFKRMIGLYFRRDLETDTFWDAEDDFGTIVLVTYHSVKDNHGGSFADNQSDGGSALCHFFGGATYEGLGDIGATAQVAWEVASDPSAPFTGYSPDARRDTAYAYLGAWIADQLQTDDRTARCLMKMFDIGYMSLTDIWGPNTTESEFVDPASLDRWLQERKAWFSDHANRYCPGSVEEIDYPTGPRPPGMAPLVAPTNLATSTASVPTLYAGPPRIGVAASSENSKPKTESASLGVAETKGELSAIFGRLSRDAFERGDAQTELELQRLRWKMERPLITAGPDVPLTNAEKSLLAEYLAYETRQPDWIPNEPTADTGDGVDTDSDGAEEPETTPSTKTLIKVALAVFGVGAVALGAYVFATGDDSQSGSTNGVESATTSSDRPPEVVDPASGTNDGSGSSEGDANATGQDETPEDVTPDAEGNTDTGSATPADSEGAAVVQPLQLEAPTALAVVDLGQERITGQVATAGAIATNAGELSNAVFSNADTGFTVSVNWEPPAAPWFASLSLAIDGEIVLESSIIDGGAEITSGLSMFQPSAEATTDPPRNRIFNPDPDAFLATLARQDQLRWEVPIPLGVPEGFDTDQTGPFDLFITIGATDANGEGPQVVRYGAGSGEAGDGWVVVDDSLDWITFQESRREGLAGVPDSIADCILESVSYSQELQGFLDGTQQNLVVPCFYPSSQVGASTAIGLAGLTGDPNGSLGCIGAGLGSRGATLEDLEALLDPWEAWPEGLLDTYAAALDECVALEPFYLARFGAFEYTREGCPQAMTTYVLDQYSWATFITEGIISSDASERDAGRTRFEESVSAGYGITSCFGVAGS